MLFLSGDKKEVEKNNLKTANDFKNYLLNYKD